jgi:hypothetical protein
LLRRAVGPAAAEKKDDGGAGLISPTPFWLKDVKIQLDIVHFFVNVGVRIVELRRIVAPLSVRGPRYKEE